MSLRRVLATVAAAALLGAGGTAAAAPAQAATKPGFQVPFICGQTWKGETRPDHSPRWAIDFNHYSATGARDDLGRRVVASAGGTVVKVVTGLERSYGNHVVIRHSGGYRTLYAHLKDGSVQVREGQSVRKGQVIARVGASGLSSVSAAHLHYEQQDSNGNDIPIVFYRDNPASYDPYRDVVRNYRSPAC
jgi:murein DD-endopeptidase MepM/ murein hydrolase activator NlpD